jgi:hypothetical protein
MAKRMGSLLDSLSKPAKKKPSDALLLLGDSPEDGDGMDTESEDEDDGELEMAMSDLKSAIDSDDPAEMAQAFRAAMELCNK